MHHRRWASRIKHFEFSAERGIVGATTVADIISAGPERARMVVAGVGISRSADVSPCLGGPLRTYRTAIAIARQLCCEIAAEGEDLFGALATPGREITRRMPAAHVGRTNGRIFCAAAQNDLLQ